MDSELTQSDGIVAAEPSPEAHREIAWDIIEKWTIPSTEASLKSASSNFAELIKDISNEDDKFWLQLGFDEAVINAVLHGNKYDPSKNVEIVINISPTIATLTIKDQGSGFVRAEISDPTTEEGKKKPSGRGIAIFENKFQVEYNKTANGMEVTLTRKLNQEKPKDGAK